jgi:hypothetical protein
MSVAVVLSAPVMASNAIHCTLLSFPAVTTDPLRILLLSVAEPLSSDTKSEKTHEWQAIPCHGCCS